jgi:hypothetical protein
MRTSNSETRKELKSKKEQSKERREIENRVIWIRQS